MPDPTSTSLSKMPEMLTTREAADEMEVSTDTIRRWQRLGLLPNSLRVGPGGRLRIARRDLEALIER